MQTRPGELQDLLVDPASSPETVYAEHQEASQRRQALAGALEVLNPRERCIFEARFLSEPSVRLEDLVEQVWYFSRASAADRNSRIRKGPGCSMRCTTKGRRVETRPSRAPKNATVKMDGV